MIKITCPECTSDEIYKYEYGNWDKLVCEFCGYTFNIKEGIENLEEE